MIKKCHFEENQFVSKIFLRPKTDGSYRLILNLKQLNEFIEVQHFKLEDIRTAKNLMYKCYFMATIDLKDAYYLVPINRNHWKYLRFVFLNELYEFTVLPFGLNCAPYIFTKLMKPVVMHLRELGFLSVIFLDDLLLIGKDYLDCVNNVNRTVLVLENLGFVLNKQKSQLIPSTVCKFLGLELDSEKMWIQLPQDKRLKIYNLVEKFRNLKRCKIREFSSFIGSLGFCCQAATYGWMYMKEFEREKIKALENNNYNFNAYMNLMPKLREDFDWWKINVFKIYSPIRFLKFSIEIFTDSSTSGWGACCQGEKIHGFWKPEERDNHINYLELLAAYLGLISFAKKVKNENILLRIDNTTAITYINRMGGTHSKRLSSIAKKLWQWCEDRKIWIFASYIRSSENVIADFESRRLEPQTEYELSDEAFHQICLKFGMPHIDLFATRCNAKCERYVSWKKDPNSIAIDAFTIDWEQWFFYAFPPFSLILKVIRKIKYEGSRGILIVPRWTSQPWYPLYMSMLDSDLIVFEPKINTLLSSNREAHPLWPQLTLVAGVLSGKPLQ